MRDVKFLTIKDAEYARQVAQEKACTLPKALTQEVTQSALETDYLVLGSGSMGMCFTDALIAVNQAANVIIVDNRARPGGHWNDTYEFSHGFWYGISDNAATYTSHAMNQPHLGRADGFTVGTAQGRVRYFPLCHLEKGSESPVIRNLLTGKRWTVRYRKRFIDGTFSRVEIPLTHKLPFELVSGVKCVPPHHLPKVCTGGFEPAGFVVIGAGRTGIDVICWLMQRGAPPSRVKWVTPSNSFVYITPVFHKHLGHLGSLDRWAEEFGIAIQEVAAEGGNALDVFRSLAGRPSGKGHRMEALHPDEPDAEIHRCCSASEEELRLLRLIPLANIIRKGYVKHIGKHSIFLEHGSDSAVEPTFGPATVFIDCSALGQVGQAAQPIWQGKMVVPQPCLFCNQAMSAAILGRLEGAFPDDVHEGYKNALGSPIPPTHTLSSVLVALEAQHKLALLWKQEPMIKTWVRQQIIFIDSRARYEEVCREDTMGSMETLTTSEAIQAVLKAEAKRTIARDKLGNASQAVALNISFPATLPAGSNRPNIPIAMQMSKL